MDDKAITISVERHSANDDSVTVVELFSEHGAFVRRGDRLCAVETSKATVEIYSPDDGYLNLECQIGTVLKIGEHIATIFHRPELVPPRRRSQSDAQSGKSSEIARATRKARLTSRVHTAAARP